MMPQGSVILWFSFLKMFVNKSPVHRMYYEVALCTRVQEFFEQEWQYQIFYLVLVLSRGEFQGTLTSEIPSTRNTQISQRVKILMILFWFGRPIGACVGRGWKYQCILYSVLTPLILSSFPRGIKFMCWRSVLSRVFVILKKHRLAIGMPCNQFIERRKIIKSVGTTKNATCLFIN